MKKYVLGLGLGAIILMLFDLGFVIKVLIILSSLFLHVYTHWVLEKIKLSRFEKVNEIINILSANIINLIIGALCFRFENEYINYIGIVNFAICAINLIPVYPFDGRGVLDIVADCMEVQDSKDKMYKVVDRGARVTLLILGLLQLILYANNFTVLILYMMVSFFRKRTKIA